MLERIADWWDSGTLHLVGNALLGMFVLVSALVFLDLVLSHMRTRLHKRRRDRMGKLKFIIAANAIEDALEAKMLTGELSKKDYRLIIGRIRRCLMEVRKDMSYRPKKLHPLYIEMMKAQIVRRLGDKKVASLPDRGVKYETKPERLTLVDRLIRKS